MLDSSFEELSVYIMMRSSDQSKYRTLMKGLVSQFSMKNDQYPKPSLMRLMLWENINLIQCIKNALRRQEFAEEEEMEMGMAMMKIRKPTHKFSN